MLLAAALKYVDVPGYAALILRRTYKDLSRSDGLIPRSHEWLEGTGARWNKETHAWIFPSTARLEFGYLDGPNDHYIYQGAAYQFVGFDELTQFPENQYRYLFSRTRKLAGVDVPLRTYSTSNPGGAGHDWVFARFVDEKTRGPKRLFVPSRLDDNPSLDRESYLESLAELDAVTRAQLERGDWLVKPDGSVFKREWFRFSDIAPAGIRWVRYWDLAATEVSDSNRDPDFTAGALVGLRRLGINSYEVWIKDVRRRRLSPGGVEAFVRATAEADGRAVPIWIEQEGGASGKNSINNFVTRVLMGWNVKGDRKTGSKSEMWTPLAAQAEAGNVYLVRGDWNLPFVDELVGLPAGHDDQADAVSGAFSKLLGDRTADRARMLAQW